MWTQSDAVSLRNFISQNKNFLTTLRERQPKITGTTVEERAMTGSDRKGYDEVFIVLDAMQQDIQTPNVSNAPII